MFNKTVKSLIGLTLLMSLNISASEVDQFSYRFEPLSDASKVVNNKANMFLKDALKITNKWARGKDINCSEKHLYKTMRKFFRNHIQGQLTPFVINSELVPKRVIPIDQSIYKSLNVWQSPVMAGASRVMKDTSGVIVKMGDTQIGSDKFEHFFGRGWAYFKKLYIHGKSLDDVMKYGDRLERYMLGAVTTGVYSYGDLAANFNGMRFWNHVLQKNNDVLGPDHNLGPYVQCKGRKWVQVKKINFLDYIDASWDEGSNCSDYKNSKTVELVNIEIDKLNTDDKTQSIECPMEPGKIHALYDKYGDLSEWLINDKSKAVFN